jgi:hypothetical protein
MRELPFKEEMDIEDIAAWEECAEEQEQLAGWLKELKAWKEAPNGDLISREALKKVFENLASDDYNEPIWYQKTVFETIDSAPTVPDRYGEGYAQGYIDGSTGADWKGGAE